MMPSETERRFFVVHALIENSSMDIHVITKDVTNFTYYVQHYQGFSLQSNYLADAKVWKCFSLDELEGSTVTRIVANTNEKDHELSIVKRWI